VPYPILYETVSTRFVKNRKAMTSLENDWRTLRRQNRLDLLPDMVFRDQAVEECFAELQKPHARYRTLSLVDRVIRNILGDVNVQSDAFVTCNPGDFVDVCTQYKRRMIVLAT
jgi:hypothetical protein